VGFDIKSLERGLAEAEAKVRFSSNFFSLLLSNKYSYQTPQSSTPNPPTLLSSLLLGISKDFGVKTAVYQVLYKSSPILRSHAAAVK